MVVLLALVAGLLCCGEAALAASGVCSLAGCSCTGEPGSSLEQRVLHCKGELELELSNLPSHFRAIHLKNITHLRVGRKALQTEALLRVDIQYVDQLLFEEKAIGLLDSSSIIKLNITDCYHVLFEPRSVSASAGDLYLFGTRLETIKIAGQAFDVLKKVDISSVGQLLVNPLSFKPNVLWSDMVDLDVSLKGVRDLPVLPSGLFSSTKAILFKDCSIKEIRGKSFSGNQIDRVAFDSCSIDRIHSNAFSEGLLLGNLTFHKCHLQAVSGRAIRSPVTSLLISETTTVSLDTHAFQPSLVVSVRLIKNDFKTLHKETLVFRSWTELIVRGNVFRFLEEGAFLGFEAEADGAEKQKSFTFTDNVVHFANMGAFQHAIPAAVTVHVANNTFMRECDCQVTDWVKMLSQASSENLLDSSNSISLSRDGPIYDIIGQLSNTSRCHLADSQSACFREQNPLIGDYLHRLCPLDPNNVCTSPELYQIWTFVSTHVEISKNKGILLVILCFALLISLLLSIYTLLRWIVYTLQIRHHRLHNEEEWNFTKVEERLIPSPQEPDRADEESPEQLTSPEDHYERLPFMTEEDEREDKSPRLSPAVETRKQQQQQQASNRNSLALAPPKATSSDPKLTFYDEMIDLLKEKLDDPNNYGTVADSTASNGAAPKRSSQAEDSEAAVKEQLVYQDPLEVKK